MSITLGIPTDREFGWRYIENACRFLGVPYKILDIYAPNWLDIVRESEVTGLIYRPEFRYGAWRELFAERITFLSSYLGLPIYPSLDELRLYENKREMASWLQFHGFPHPRTTVISTLASAREYISGATLPIVTKTAFGNAGQGIRLFHNKRAAYQHVSKIFNNGYRAPTYEVTKAITVGRLKAVARPLYRWIRRMPLKPRDITLDNVIFQSYVAIHKEWRTVRIGDSFFGHDKLVDRRGFHSGGGKTSWAVPPDEVFELCLRACERGGFRSMGVDIFETSEGNYLINELQTVFGVVANNQMYRLEGNELIGFRKIYSPGSKSWTSQDGEFGHNMCYNLRVKDFVRILLESGASSSKKYG